MMAIRSLFVGCIGGAALMLGAGCASDFAPDAGRSRPTRAVESPVERNSASGEMSNMAAMSGVPLVEVGIPNSRDQALQVRTIADNIFRPTPPVKPPTSTTFTPPASVTIGGTTQPETPITRPAPRIDPLLGPQD